MKHTTWVDVTELIDWRGTHTGIQRVAFHLAQQFGTDKQLKAKFVRFDDAKRRFIEVDYEKVIKHISAKSKPFQHQPARPRKVLKQIKYIYRKLSPIILQRAVTTAWANLKRVLRRKHTFDIAKAKFESGDILFVGSGNWENFPMLAAIKKLTQKYQLRYMQVIFDLIPVVKPKLVHPRAHVRFKWYISFLSNYANHVFAISESTKKDYLAATGAKSSSVSVFRAGEDFLSARQAVKPASGIEPNSYILSVSTIEIRKNHTLLYHALKHAQSYGVELPKIVIIGRPGWLSDDFTATIRSDDYVSGKIEVINTVSDDELVWYYQNCLFTIFPSLYEGWGLPIAESLFYGKVCLSSDTSSMPEIGGSLVKYFQPDDPIAAFELMKEYTENEKARQLLEAKIHRQYKKTTWRQSYETIQSIIKTTKRRKT